ncbi:Clo7bot family Cys-rich peptide [Tepidibacter hydrothermalis]|uniref:Clo7bot family Cys-rich peptide n=1 Tax=Tepidibacter hydrothermalis TaxID=3036126 RepID=A0ABY8ECW5_9FIRM|nr:Clo7bot family Cys-rich peptide [Tepidibacter hydrothermalis]WFD10766.1 Clo7bot family Cys-rich peptide [Tepidibacter hydrothermalis]
MKYIVKPKGKYTQGYCLSCSTQCNNNCSNQSPCFYLAHVNKLK